MNFIRWIICFPTAMMLSVFAWVLAAERITRAYYGPTLYLKITGLAPLVFKTAFPAAVFVIIGVLLSPSKERRIVFVFFTLALLFSGGGIEVLGFAQQTDTGFWLSANLGTVLGALVGLAIALRLQNGRKKRQSNKCTTDNSGELTLPSVSDC